MKSFGKKSRNKTLFAILPILLFVLAACDTGNKGGIACFDKPFAATVEGYVDGTFIKAEVFCDPTEHITKEIYNVITVTFNAPASLEGITVSLRSDNKATARLKNMEEDMPLYEKFVEPYVTLIPESEYSAIEKTDDGFKVMYNKEGSDLIYYFDADGYPKSVEGEATGRKVSLKIIKFTQNGK